MAAEEIPPLEAGETLPEVPAAPFASAIDSPVPPSPGSDAAGDTPQPPRALPQTIAHRGYKAAYPENSMIAFQEAVAVGAHALETDVHLSRDGVVVLSHDPTLSRCFSIPDKVSSHTWPYLSTLRTTAPPHVPLARLSDLLAYLVSHPSLSSIWVLLDIKTDDDPLLLVPALAATFSSVAPPPGFPAWPNRIVLGGWNENWLAHLSHFCPSYPQAYIGFSLLYARKFLDDKKYPGMGFNLLQQSLVGPLGAAFMRRIKKAPPPPKEEEKRKLFVWTVNEEEWMEWCCRKGEKGLIDGVITDDPKLFREVCKRYLSSPSSSSSSSAGEDRRQEEAGNQDKKSAVTATTTTTTTATVTRQRKDGESTVRRARRYLKAFGIQFLTLFFAVILWHRLRTLGGPPPGNKKKNKNTKTELEAGKMVPITS